MTKIEIVAQKLGDFLESIESHRSAHETKALKHAHHGHEVLEAEEQGRAGAYREIAEQLQYLIDDCQED